MKVGKGIDPTGSGRRFYRRETVLQAAYDRLEFIFDEFRNVIVSVSGGKDSTVVLNLALEVARRKDRLPLKVFWLDQEAEWQSTVDLSEHWMTLPDVEPIWLQVPFRIFNATSSTEHWLHAWDPARERDWVHPQHPVALHENVYGTDRFAGLFDGYLRHAFPDEPVCSLTGVRAEESPQRKMGLTHYATYKWVTWGAVRDRRRQHYSFHPLYDWSYTDVWKAIFDHGWRYNRVYDEFFRYGKPIRDMRVSNLHHETAIQNLFPLQEIEPDTYARLVNRIAGIDMAAKMNVDYFPQELPFMFASWREYRDHLLEHLVDDEYQPHLRKHFDEHDLKLPPSYHDEAHRVHVHAILAQDWEGVKLDNFLLRQDVWQAQIAEEGRWRPVTAAARQARTAAAA